MSKQSKVSPHTFFQVPSAPPPSLSPSSLLCPTTPSAAPDVSCILATMPKSNTKPKMLWCRCHDCCAASGPDGALVTKSTKERHDRDTTKTRAAIVLGERVAGRGKAILHSLIPGRGRGRGRTGAINVFHTSQVRDADPAELPDNDTLQVVEPMQIDDGIYEGCSHYAEGNVCQGHDNYTFTLSPGPTDSLSRMDVDDYALDRASPEWTPEPSVADDQVKSRASRSPSFDFPDPHALSDYRPAGELPHHPPHTPADHPPSPSSEIEQARRPTRTRRAPRPKEVVSIVEQPLLCRALGLRDDLVDGADSNVDDSDDFDEFEELHAATSERHIPDSLSVTDIHALDECMPAADAYLVSHDQWFVRASLLLVVWLQTVYHVTYRACSQPTAELLGTGLAVSDRVCSIAAADLRHPWVSLLCIQNQRRGSG
ncbi:hypothetical protein NEOLEDRAFT_1174175 [Neolentinus lepideus HHB14362 ss-1]|uniref:Uncharacterized protein n=1 Tax=Neolentinus lepideus HHB14362 ss-1 TaxID=1314782 RepID=A0A165W7W2_9AGAM|nr:hypothetical protein NEOLEDRAFT_1174175 [Neolentinus lepideus HHB14362 ss-1]